jgi:hypothetical protein
MDESTIEFVYVPRESINLIIYLLNLLKNMVKDDCIAYLHQSYVERFLKLIYIYSTHVHVVGASSALMAHFAQNIKAI